MINLTETEKAYLAGIFDGEGCVGYYKRKGNRSKYSYVALAMIGQSDIRLMNWLQSKLGFGTVTSSPGKINVEYHWAINKKTVVYEFLSAIRPYLLLKADQVDALLELMRREGFHPTVKGQVTPEVLASREKVYMKLKQLKIAHLEPIPVVTH